MDNINLSKYVGKNVTAELRSGGIICAPVFLTNNNEDSLFKYSFCGVWYAKYGYLRNEGEDDLDIVKILEVEEPTSGSEMVEQNAISILEARGYKIEKPFVLDFDWSCLPKWANAYVFVDDDNEWWSQGDDLDCGNVQIPAKFAPKNFKNPGEEEYFFKNPNIKE